MRKLLIVTTAALTATAAGAQTATLTPFALPGFIGAAAAITADAPTLNVRARSLRVIGSGRSATP